MYSRKPLDTQNLKDEEEKFNKAMQHAANERLLSAKIKNDIWKIRRKFYTQVFHLEKYSLEIPL